MNTTHGDIDIQEQEAWILPQDSAPVCGMFKIAPEEISSENDIKRIFYMCVKLFVGLASLSRALPNRFSA